MDLPGHSVGGAEVVGLGTIVAPGKTDIVINPFIKFENYRLKFLVVWDSKSVIARSDIVADPDNRNLSTLLLTMKWGLSVNNITGHHGLHFASTQEKSFEIAYFFEAIGSLDEHLVRLSFTTYGKPRS